MIEEIEKINMVPKYRAVNFDLSLALLRKYYPKKNILNAYKDIKRFFLQNNFSHRQWSGYRSCEKLSDIEIIDIMVKMFIELPWVQDCSRKIDVTNIENIYDMKRFYDDNKKYFSNIKVEREISKDEKHNTLDFSIKRASSMLSKCEILHEKSERDMHNSR